MIPTVVIEHVKTPLGQMVLSQRGRQFVIRVDGIELMSSNNHRSEDELGKIACTPIAGLAAPSVLIGGLGLGYTLRAALDTLPSAARVDIVELIPEVVRWNRTVLADLAGNPLADKRVRLIEGDVAEVIARPTSPYDAIILDVDNGPDGIAQHNDGLYRVRGLAATRAALAPDGILAVWSSFQSQTFTRWLRNAGFDPTVRRIRAHGVTHWIWLAKLAPSSRYPSRALQSDRPGRANRR